MRSRGGGELQFVMGRLVSFTMGVRRDRRYDNYYSLGHTAISRFSRLFGSRYPGTWDMIVEVSLHKTLPDMPQVSCDRPNRCTVRGLAEDMRYLRPD